MQFDVFISYAWGGPENTAHREWVRLLAAHLKQIGFHVGIDSEVDYGGRPHGFHARDRGRETRVDDRR